MSSKPDRSGYWRIVRTLVTGATGYIGSRLVPELLERGHDVVASYHSDPKPTYPWADRVEWRRVDVLDERDIVQALDGVDAAVYLVHGLDSADFSQTDRESAENMRDAVTHTGVRRLVYLSGIVPEVPEDQLSEHIASRLEVERILAESAAATLALRAAIVIGSGSTSFEIVRQLSERLKIFQAVPTWMRSTRVQPVAIEDAVWYLAEALERPDVTGHLDIGGPDTLTYPELLTVYARIAGLTRLQVPVPGLSSNVAGLVAGQFTDVETEVVMSLMASLHDDMVAATPAELRLGEPPDGRLGVEESIRRALQSYGEQEDGGEMGADPAAPSLGDPQWSRAEDVS